MEDGGAGGGEARVEARLDEALEVELWGEDGANPFQHLDLPQAREAAAGRLDRRHRHLAAVDSRIKELMMANVLDTFSP